MSAHRTVAAILRLLTLLALPLLAFLAACADAEEEELQQPLQSPSPTEQPTAVTSTPSAVPTNAPPASPTPPADPVPADWETYTDADYAFSLRYPPELLLEDLSDPSSPLSQRVLQFRAPDGANVGFALVIADNDKGLSPEEWAREFSTCSLDEGDEADSVIVDGVNGVMCLGEPLAGKFESVVVLPRDGSIMYLTSTLAESDFESVISGLDLS